MKERQVHQRRPKLYVVAGRLSRSSSPEIDSFKKCQNLISINLNHRFNFVDLADDGSPQSATVKIEVPVTGVDTGSDITITSGDMFKTVIAKARSKKEEFKTANKQAFTCNKQWVSLDGQINITSALYASRYALPFM